MQASSFSNEQLFAPEQHAPTSPPATNERAAEAPNTMSKTSTYLISLSPLFMHRISCHLRKIKGYYREFYVGKFKELEK